MKIRSTTILCVRKGNQVALGGDGQVTMGNAVAKGDATKIRRLEVTGNITLTGFAGSAADAFALLEKFEGKLKESPGNLRKAAVELAKLWRTDRALRRLEALIVVADKSCTLIIGGSGDVIEPNDGVAGIGSGGSFATAAARALMKHSELSAEDIVRESLQIAGEICIYTNTNISVEKLDI